MSDVTLELRRLLDERGVEYDTDDEDGCEFTEWVANGLEWEADSRGELVSLMPVMLITPAQAIAATLGSCNCPNNCTNSERTETCKLDDFADVPFSVDYEIEGYDMDSGRDYATLAECSACGAYILVPPEYHHVLTCDGDEVYQPYRFCPNCGRRIEQ